MNHQEIINLLLHYRYAILIPLSIVEGPIVAFISGTLASAGFFNIFALLIFFFIRDMVMDGFYYLLGYLSGRSFFVQKLLKKVGVQQIDLLKIKEIWNEYPLRTMFIGKISYGVAQIFILSAGMIRLRLRKFFGYGALIAISQYSVYLFLGYFISRTFQVQVSNIFDLVQYIIAFGGLALWLYYIFIWRRARKKLLGKNFTTIE